MTELINDVRENARCFSQEEALWCCFEKKRKKVRERSPRRQKILDDLLDRLAWDLAEREMRPPDCIGKMLP